MDDIRVLIADDNEAMRLIERKMIGKVEGFTLVGEARDGLECLDMVEKLRPQIVFLDVEMPGKTGVECARVIQDMDPGIILIFATAHDDYMGEAFEVYAFDYLVKPFKVSRVLKTLERARDRLNPEKDEPPLPMPAASRSIAPSSGRMMLHHRDGVTFINMTDIVLVQREDRQTVIYTRANGSAEGNRYVTADSLAETEARLDPAVFFRSHKSYIINLNCIANITPYGRWTYVVRLTGITQDALITHEKYEELERLFS